MTIFTSVKNSALKLLMTVVEALRLAKMPFHPPGGDGVFAINKTSGCLTLRAYPAHLRKEMFHVKVKVSAPLHTKPVSVCCVLGVWLARSCCCLAQSLPHTPCLPCDLANSNPIEVSLKPITNQR